MDSEKIDFEFIGRLTVAIRKLKTIKTKNPYQSLRQEHYQFEFACNRIITDLKSAIYYQVEHKIYRIDTPNVLKDIDNLKSELHYSHRYPLTEVLNILDNL